VGNGFLLPTISLPILYSLNWQDGGQAGGKIR